MRPHRFFAFCTLLLCGCDELLPDNGTFNEKLSLRADATGVVINEILYEPLSGVPEYIEIYNAGVESVDLGQWRVTDNPNATDAQKASLSSCGGSMLGPGEYAMVVAEKTGCGPGLSELYARYPYLPGAAARFFSLSKTLSLNNTGDAILLFDNHNQLVDRVAYSPGWHNPANHETRRISLEKYNPLMPSDSPLSWGSSTDSQYGATPGKINSIYLAPSRSEEFLTAEPNPFSPDGDGKNDLLVISVNLPKGAYRLALAVWDGMGAKARTLAAGLPAGPAMRIAWDGRDDAGKQLPSGSYRLTMEAGGSGSTYQSALVFTLVR